MAALNGDIVARLFPDPCLGPDFGLYPEPSCSNPMVTSTEGVDMARIEGEIVVDRPVEAVFDYVADQSNEPQYNPQMVRAEKITPGPVRAGTTFRSAVASRGRTAEMLIECTGYDRPRRLTSTTTMRQADISYALTFEPAGAGTRMACSEQVRPKGAYILLGADHLAGRAPGTVHLGEPEAPHGSIPRRCRHPA